MAEFNALLLTLQIAMHLIITLRLATYTPCAGSKYKPGVSFLAAAMAGSSAVCAYQALISWPVIIHETAQPFTTIFVAVVLAGIMRSRGNVANLLPR